MSSQERKRKPWNRGNTVHGLVHSKTWMMWRSMVSRATPNSMRPYKSPPRTVDATWLASFQSFVGEMGVAPEGTTLRLRLGATHYCQANCAWRPKSEPAIRRSFFDDAVIDTPANTN